MSYNSPFTGNVIQPTDVAYASYALPGSIQLEWPINGSVSNFVAARIMQVSTTSSSYELWMPPANQASVGQDALIYNTGGVSLTVKTFGGASTIVTIPPTGGSAQYIFITSNANTSGTWGVIAFGSTTTNSNAAALAGAGLEAIGSTLNGAYPANAITNGYLFSAADRAVADYWAGGTGVGTLPFASSLGDNWFVMFRNSGTGTYQINCAGSETIDGTPNKQFNPDESAFIICTGSSYFTVGYGQSSTFAFSTLYIPVSSGSYILSASQCANVIQEVNGTLSNDVLITYPPIVNFYVVKNITASNGHTVILTTGIIGGSTVTIPSGATATVVCDGTNMFNANTVQSGGTLFSIADGSAANPSLNFSSETNTGIFRPGAGVFGLSILGTQKFYLDATGLKGGTF